MVVQRVSREFRLCSLCAGALVMGLGVALSGASAWGDTTLRIRDRAAVGRATIRVSDLAEVEDDDADRSRLIGDLELCPTPTVSRSMGIGEIRDRLELLGVDLFEIRFQGSLAVLIEPVIVASPLAFEGVAVPSASSRVPARGASTGSAVSRGAEASSESQPQLDVVALERFCRTRLERRVEELGLEWESVSITSGAQRSIAGSRWVSVELVESGEQREIVLKVDRMGSLESVAIPLVTRSMPQVVFVRGTVSRGQVLMAEDLEMRPWPSRDLARATTDPQAVVGKEVDGLIQRDRPVDPGLLKSPTLVRRGARVTVVSRVGEIRVSTTGTAMGEGGLGNEITVQLADRRRSLQGRVTGENRVEVMTAAPAGR